MSRGTHLSQVSFSKDVTKSSSRRRPVGFPNCFISLMEEQQLYSELFTLWSRLVVEWG